MSINEQKSMSINEHQCFLIVSHRQRQVSERQPRHCCPSAGSSNGPQWFAGALEGALLAPDDVAPEGALVAPEGALVLQVDAQEGA